MSILESLPKKLSGLNSCQNLLGIISLMFSCKSVGTESILVKKMQNSAKKIIGKIYGKIDTPVISGINIIKPPQALLEVVIKIAVVIDINIERQINLFTFLLNESSNAAKLRGQIIQNQAPA